MMSLTLSPEQPHLLRGERRDFQALGWKDKDATLRIERMLWHTWKLMSWEADKRESVGSKTIIFLKILGTAYCLNEQGWTFLASGTGVSWAIWTHSQPTHGSRLPDWPKAVPQDHTASTNRKPAGLGVVAHCRAHKKPWVSTCCWQRHSHVRTPVLTPWKKQNLPRVWGRTLAVCAENVHHSFSPTNVNSLTTTSLQILLLPRLEKPDGLLVQPYAVTVKNQAHSQTAKRDSATMLTIRHLHSQLPGTHNKTRP